MINVAVVGNKIARYYCCNLKLYRSSHSVRDFWTVYHSFETSQNEARPLRLSRAPAMSSGRQALLLSSSNCYGYSYLNFAKQDICSFLQTKKTNELVFIPYAQKNYDNYTAKVSEVLEKWGINVTGIHKYPNPEIAINNAKAIFVGGGNTFLLLKTLYENQLVSLIRQRVYDGNLLYIGSSAGSNVATRSIHTTNDMPIAFPPSFDAIRIVPFNINPHYINTIESETHNGESRDQRIFEYLEMEYAAPVLGLKEGCILHVHGNSLTIKGVAGAVLFLKDHKSDLLIGSDVSFLLTLAEGDRALRC